jgi:hypothetical protein
MPTHREVWYQEGEVKNREKKENLTLLMKPKVGRMPGQKGARSWGSSEVRRWRCGMKN